jgi:hypothetical protein
MDEIRCPHCGKPLDERWLAKQGASLLGKTGRGKAKARTNAREAAQARWARAKQKGSKALDVFLLFWIATGLVTV